MQQDSRVRLIAAGTIGNVLEWYDFAVYGFFAIPIGQTFFAKSDPVAQVLAAFGVFAVGYVMRPLGGMLTGVIADRYGRRVALSFSITAMAVPTFLVGLLPGYATLGIAAAGLLVLLRMIQGLSVGGEYTTSFTFLIESALPHRRGLTSAIACCSAVAGMLLGSGVGTLMASLLTPTALTDWGWRVPFLLGLLVGVVGYLLRRHVQDARPPEPARSPLADTFRHHKTLLVRLACLAAFPAVSFYLMFLYVVSWLQQVDGIPPARALGINTLAMATLIPVMLAAGWLSDRVGRTPPLMAATILGIAGAVPFLWLMHRDNDGLILLGQFGYVLVAGIAIAIAPSLMVEATPAPVRCTAIAIGYNLAYGVMGGLAPVAAAWLVSRTGQDLTPAYMVVGVAGLSLAAVVTFRGVPAYRGELA